MQKSDNTHILERIGGCTPVYAGRRYTPTRKQCGVTQQCAWTARTYVKDRACPLTHLEGTLEPVVVAMRLWTVWNQSGDT